MLHDWCDDADKIDWVDTVIVKNEAGHTLHTFSKFSFAFKSNTERDCKHKHPKVLVLTVSE